MVGYRSHNLALPTGSSSYRIWLEPIPYQLRVTRCGESDPLLTAPGTGPALELALARAVIGDSMVRVRGFLRRLGPSGKGVGGDKFLVQHEARIPEFHGEVG